MTDAEQLRLHAASLRGRGDQYLTALSHVLTAIAGRMETAERMAALEPAPPRQWAEPQQMNGNVVALRPVRWPGRA